MTCQFTVHGTPAPQGSKRAFKLKGSNRVVMVESSKNVKSWRQDVASVALIARPDGWDMSGPMHVGLQFVFKRPLAHFNKAGLKPGAPRKHTGRPDSDKLARSVLDALTGILFDDDSQVSELYVRKIYATGDASDGPGLIATVGRMQP